MESHEVKKYVAEHKEQFMVEQEKKDDHGIANIGLKNGYS